MNLGPAGMPRRTTPVGVLQKLEPLTPDDIPYPTKSKITTMILVSGGTHRHLVPVFQSQLNTNSFQGPLGEKVDVVHAVAFLPLRWDSHVELSKHIGYLVKLYSKQGRDYGRTHMYVLDLLFQNFFPGPTWMAASNVRGSGEPLPDFVNYRYEAMLCEYPSSNPIRCVISLVTNVHPSPAAYMRLVWNTYRRNFGLPKRLDFDNSINMNDKVKGSMNRRVSNVITSSISLTGLVACNIHDPYVAGTSHPRRGEEGTCQSYGASDVLREILQGQEASQGQVRSDEVRFLPACTLREGCGRCPHGESQVE